jgi:hypothetical protein
MWWTHLRYFHLPVDAENNIGTYDGGNKEEKRKFPNENFIIVLFTKYY